MTALYGALVGAAYANSGAVPKSTSHFHEKGTNQVLVRDRIELAAAAVNDTVSLGKFGSNAYLDPEGCVIRFDDLGATTTLDVGYAAIGSIVADPDAFFAAHDVNAAAGSVSLFKSIDIAKFYDPLWKLLGLASDPGGQIELIATIKGGAATGTLVWSFKGQDR